MSEETAQLILAIITVIAFTAWVAGLQFLLRSARKPTDPDGPAMPELPGNWLHTSAEVAGTPAELIEKATSLLVRDTTGLGTLKILDRKADRVSFERVGPGMANQACPGLQKGELRFTPAGNKTRIDVFLDVARLHGLLAIGFAISALGLIAIILGCYLIYTYVTTSPIPGIRWQTLQMLQCVHLLWPPFMLGALYRRFGREARSRFEALTHNLPYLGNPTP